MGQLYPLTVTCTPPMVVETLPVESSVRPAGVAGPMGCVGSLAKRVMISPAPIRATSYVTWGEYGTFAVALPLGGGLPAGAGALRANICVPPDTTQGS